MDENDLVLLHHSAKALHAEIRKMFGPEGDDDILEVQIFSAVAITIGLVRTGKVPDSEASRAIHHSYFMSRMLAEQWHMPFEEMGARFEERYAEYAPLVAANFQKASFAMMNALDRHITGEPAKDRERQKHMCRPRHRGKWDAESNR